MIKITTARRQGIIASLFFLPFFVIFAGWAMFKGLWLEGFVILGGWLFVFLFMTSYLFQALVVLVGTIYYAISQKVWWVGLVGLLLAAYLYRASKITDGNMVTLFERLSSISPTLENTIRSTNDPRKRLVMFLVIGVLVIITTVLVLFATK